jgi:aspartyl protease family protein
MPRHLLTALLLTLPALALARPPVEVLALFKDRAVIRSGAEQQMLKVGEATADGVTLLKADATGARVRYRDEEFELSLSRQVAGRFQQAERQRVSISPDSLGQYRIRGAINSQFVNFLVDTGASVVAMSRRHAESLGLDREAGEEGRVQTAQGTVRSHFVTLDQVEVGGLKAHNVRAAVIDAEYPAEILLGMSFLRNVGMEEREGVLTLVQKH